jgi:hypothetical protein
MRAFSAQICACGSAAVVVVVVVIWVGFGWDDYKGLLFVGVLRKGCRVPSCSLAISALAPYSRHPDQHGLVPQVAYGPSVPYADAVVCPASWASVP